MAALLDERVEVVEKAQERRRQAPTTTREHPVDADAEKPFKYEARVTFATPEHATVVARSLAVDPELRPKEVSKSITSEGNDVILKLAAVDPRTLRASACTLCDLAGVAARAVEAFGADEKTGTGLN